MRTIDIAVCGSGIGGLAAALALAMYGHRVTVFEKVDAPRAIGSGLMLQPTGQAALARLGLLDTVLVHGRRLTGIAGKTRQGRTIFDIAYDALGADMFGIGIHRGALFQVLDDARARQEIAVVTAADVAASEISGDKRTLADVRGNDCGTYDLVVDATGLRSPLRKAYASIRLDKPYPYGAVWGVVEEPLNWPHGDTLTQCYDGAHTMIGVLPVGRLPGSARPLSAFFWSLRNADIDAWRATDFATWQNRVSDIWPAAAPFVGQFARHADLAHATYADIWLTAPYVERLAFVGDSARAASPQLGQGANLALIDAIVLADCLAEHVAVADALSAYAALRRDHTRFYGLASRWLTPFFQSDSRFAGTLRDLGFAPLAGIPYLRREMVRTLAGIKTGLFSHQTAARIVNTRRHSAIPVGRSLRIPR